MKWRVTLLPPACRMVLAVMASLGARPACTAPVNYDLDPNHTHPMFEVDHYGMSMWRGIFRHTYGTVTLDTAASTGTVDVTVDVASVDFGNDQMNNVAVNSTAPAILEAAMYPTAHYNGTLGGFVNGAPTTVTGTLTLHGVTRPLTLHVDIFKCIPIHPVLKREVCGADASGSFDRAAFGITVGQKFGFKMDVTLRIQVEAIKTEP